MSALREALGDYLEMRRALGYRLEQPARVLDAFVSELEARGLEHVASVVAFDFANGAGAVPRAEAAKRLSAIRIFARYLKALDDAHEVPPPRLLPAVVERKAPHLYSDEELAALMAAARRIEEPLRALSMWTLIGLLACSGLRPGEAVALVPADVDLRQDVITVRDSKWGSSRLVPLHASASDALARYRSACAGLFGHDDQPRFFMWTTTKPLRMPAATVTFRRLLAEAGIAAPAGRRPPRLYDLRHRFAVSTLVRWYRDGVDVGEALPGLSTYLGHQQPKDTYWYLQAVPELLQAAAALLEASGPELERWSALAPVLERYFSEQLPARRVSPRTIDAFCLLLAFAERRLRRRPADLDLSELDASLVMAFLDHLESERHNSVVTRNLRLAAIHGFFAYAALRCPEHAGSIGRVLAVPHKRTDQRLVSFLTRPETDALLAAPDRDSWLGRRDRTLLALATQTGLRVSELTGLCRRDVNLAAGPAVRCLGKGRRERATPLTASNVRLLRAFMAERAGGPDDPLFPTRRGAMSSDAVADLVTKYVAVAAERCPSLRSKHVTPHTLRHTAAMRLIEAGVDTATVALWLGHASIRSTAVYIHADLAMKQKALDRTAPSALTRGRYRPPDELLAFLKGL